MATPERQQDPGEHGYGGGQQEKDEDGAREHPLENPEADPRQDDDDREGRRGDERGARDADTTSREQSTEEAFTPLSPLRPGAAG